MCELLSYLELYMYDDICQVCVYMLGEDDQLLCFYVGFLQQDIDVGWKQVMVMDV